MDSLTAIIIISIEQWQAISINPSIQVHPPGITWLVPCIASITVRSRTYTWVASNRTPSELEKKCS